LAEIIECVPNISEGRRQDVIDRIVKHTADGAGVLIFDVKPDSDHNRTVITMFGTKEGVREAIYRLFEATLPEIDLREHKGEHKRMGAVDVVPFIPIRGATMEECITLSKEVAAAVAERFTIPVYLYERSASNPDRENLANIRKGEFEGFSEKIKDPTWKPDFGPTEVHTSAGCVAIGARQVLVAFNVNLNTPDVSIADEIAKKIRYIGGGLRYCKAAGVALEERKIVQVSMNLTDYTKTPIWMAYELIKDMAERRGIAVLGCELIGMAPSAALFDVANYFLHIEGFRYEQVFEVALAEKGM
jgi:glutamate formiminotransferase / 5-formyltetrahydrofolate cyclo-ligase